MIRLKVKGDNEIWVNPHNIRLVIRNASGSELILMGDLEPIYVEEAPEVIALYVKKFYAGRLKQNG